MKAHHKSFHDQDVFGRLQKLACLACIECDRFLAKDVLACLRRPECERHMQVVGQRIVDCLDLGIGEQSFIRVVSFGNAERSRGFARAIASARGDRADLAPFTFLHSRKYFLRPDASRAEHAPDDFLHGRLPA
jgi:hypothetical protein